MKIRTTKRNRANLTVNIDGVSVAFNDKLEAELTEEEAKKVKAKDPINILLEGEEVEVSEESTEETPETPVEGAPISPAEAEKLIAERKAKSEAEEAAASASQGGEPEPAPEVEAAEEVVVEVTEEAPEVTEEAKEVVVEEATAEESSEEDINVADLTLAELKDFCKEEEYPGKEWNGLNKADLVAYVEGKIAE